MSPKNLITGLHFPTSGGVRRLIPVPLVSVDVTATMVQTVAHVMVTQVYVNKEKNPIETVFYFPMDVYGAVTHFEAEVGGRTIKAEVKTNDEAQEAYDEAVEDQQMAFILEQMGPDCFSVQVGFLKPKGTAKIVVGYTTEVKNDEVTENTFRFLIPVTIVPIYTPRWAAGEKLRELCKLKFSPHSPAPISIKVNVCVRSPIKKIKSPTHKIEVTQNGPMGNQDVPNETWTKAVVTLKGQMTSMDRDFLLLVRLNDPHKPCLYSEKQGNSLVLMAHLIPSFKLDEFRVELIFLLDRSGSMVGQGQQLADRALNLLLRSLPIDSFFNVIDFGSSYKFCFSTSQKSDLLNIQRAMNRLNTARDLGGAEIFQPLDAIYAALRVPGHLRQILVITNGQILHTESVLRLAKVRSADTRLFCLGVSANSSSSRRLIEGMARAGGGSCTFLTNHEKDTFEGKVLKQLSNALMPPLTGIKIKWNGLPALEEMVIHKREKPKIVCHQRTLLGYGKPILNNDDGMKNGEESFEQVPQKIQPLYDGVQILVFGIFKNFKQPPTGLTITAQSPDGPLSISMELSADGHFGDTGMLHRLAAIKIVRQLEEQVAELEFQRFQFWSDRKEFAEDLKKKIITYSMEQGLASIYTSLVATCPPSIESQKMTSKLKSKWDTMQTRLIPIQYARNGDDRNDTRHSQVGTEVERTDPVASAPQVRRGSEFVITAPEVPLRCCKTGVMSKSILSRWKSHSRPSLSSKCRGLMKSRGADAHKSRDYDISSCVETRSLPKSPYIVGKGEEISKPVPQGLDYIISFQSFDGSFPLSQSFVGAMGQPLDFELVKREPAKHQWDENVWATVLALTFLSQKFNQDETSWVLAATRANKWLHKRTDGSKLEEMRALASTFFRPDGTSRQYGDGIVSVYLNA